MAEVYLMISEQGENFDTNMVEVTPCKTLERAQSLMKAEFEKVSSKLTDGWKRKVGDTYMSIEDTFDGEHYNFTIEKKEVLE